MDLNNDLDELLLIKAYNKGSSLKRANSLGDLRTSYESLIESEDKKSRADSFPHKLDSNEEIERLKAIHEFILEYRQQLADINNKGD